MGSGKAGKTSSDIECHYFELFRSAYPACAGAPSYGDKPDVILSGERKIGIEITNFFLQPGGDSESEQRQRPLRADVVSKAHKLYRATGGRAIELTFNFDSSSPISSRRQRKLPLELAELAKLADSRSSGPLERCIFSHIPELSFVYLNTQDYHEAEWRISSVYTVGWMSASALEQIVREKEIKSTEYEKCDGYWLLIIVEGMDAAQEQEIRVEDLKISSEIFEKIVVYKPGFEHIVEVWP